MLFIGVLRCTRGVAMAEGISPQSGCVAMQRMEVAREYLAEGLR